MNRLRLDIGLDTEKDQTLLVFIDEVEFRTLIGDELNAAFFEELENSLKGSGNYLIFTCNCGIADCGGWDYTKVIHTDETISWSFNYGKRNFTFQFKKGNYEKEINKIKQRLKIEGVKLSPEFVVGPE